MLLYLSARGIFEYYHSGRGLSASFADEYAKYFDEDIYNIDAKKYHKQLTKQTKNQAAFC